MPQLTLDQRFRAGPPQRDSDQYHNWLTAEERRFILWALKERWSAVRIGRALKVNAATVRRFRKNFWAEPVLLLELGLFEMVGRAREQEYRCLVCEERVVTRHQVERHLLGHFLEEATIAILRPEPVTEDIADEDDQMAEPSAKSVKRRRRTFRKLTQT